MTMTFVTLGPAGTNHELAARLYIQFQGLTDARIVFVDDFMVGLQQVRDRKADFILIHAAHPQSYQVIETHHHEVFLIDTFICATQKMGLLARKAVSQPRSLGVMPAARGYLDLSRFETVTHEGSNPAVARGLLGGKYDAGFTFLSYAEEHPTELRVELVIGSVDVPWLVFGRKRRTYDTVIGIKNPALFEPEK